jgi:prophage antirepressor-like protein
MEQLTIVYYNEVSIPVYGAKHNPWFSGIDAAKALGYSDPIRAVSHNVEAEDKILSPMLVNEYGLCLLIAGSNNKDAKRFFVEYALPQIHKSGKFKPCEEIAGRKKYARLYELASGEKLSKLDLAKRAFSLGMTKSNANHATVAQLKTYIDDREKKIAQGDELEAMNVEYPYSYDEAEEISQYNLTSIMHILPKGSYKEVCGVVRSNETAIAAIRGELSKWR